MTKKISATRLRSTLFDALRDVQRGASILIERNGKVIARLVPSTDKDWRQEISEQPRSLVLEKDVFAPIEDLFDE